MDLCVSAGVDLDSMSYLEVAEMLVGPSKVSGVWWHGEIFDYILENCVQAVNTHNGDKKRKKEIKQEMKIHVKEIESNLGFVKKIVEMLRKSVSEKVFNLFGKDYTRGEVLEKLNRFKEQIPERVRQVIEQTKFRKHFVFDEV